MERLASDAGALCGSSPDACHWNPGAFLARAQRIGTLEDFIAGKGDANIYLAGVLTMTFWFPLLRPTLYQMRPLQFDGFSLSSYWTNIPQHEISLHLRRNHHYDMARSESIEFTGSQEVSKNDVMQQVCNQPTRYLRFMRQEQSMAS